ncbi:hypothetical protein DSO57_1031532 [Entomophthora muscae]|uniref:Uncharacterized protein n=1 Tax=Entomophthora muscae TaxID=34485 RepID=A0ACC2RRJ6_9FUNG|nr:hypothetical protein DSO57_1031532 [Entomophthora muscae]
MNFVVKLVLCLQLLGAWVVSKKTKIHDLRLCRPENIRERKNFNDLTDEERGRLFRAIKKLNDMTSGENWEFFTKVHVKYFKFVHDTPLFLIWHRMYLFKLESALRSIGNTVSLPYWDWTHSSQKPSKDKVFSPQNFGGQGDPRDECVKDGRFRKLRVALFDGGKRVVDCIKRDPGFFSKVFQSPEPMEQTTLNKSTILEFSSHLEVNGHAIVHNTIGSNFMAMSSPADPLFYLHHAFVDKLWYDRQKRNFGEKFPRRAINEKKLLPPWNINPMHLIDPLSHMCYFYKENLYSWEPTYTSYKRRAAGDNATFADQNLITTRKEKDEAEDQIKECSDKIYQAIIKEEKKGKEGVKENILSQGLVAPKPEDKKDMCNLRVPDPPSRKYMKVMRLNITQYVKYIKAYCENKVHISRLNTQPGFVSISALVQTNNSLSTARCTRPDFNVAKKIDTEDVTKPITKLQADMLPKSGVKSKA